LLALAQACKGGAGPPERLLKRIGKWFSTFLQLFSTAKVDSVQLEIPLW
jgi:hypothetical protein